MNYNRYRNYLMNGGRMRYQDGGSTGDPIMNSASMNAEIDAVNYAKKKSNSGRTGSRHKAMKAGIYQGEDGNPLTSWDSKKGARVFTKDAEAQGYKAGMSIDDYLNDGGKAKGAQKLGQWDYNDGKLQNDDPIVDNGNNATSLPTATVSLTKKQPTITVPQNKSKVWDDLNSGNRALDYSMENDENSEDDGGYNGYDNIYSKTVGHSLKNDLLKAEAKNRFSKDSDFDFLNKKMGDYNLSEDERRMIQRESGAITYMGEKAGSSPEDYQNAQDYVNEDLAHANVPIVEKQLRRLGVNRNDTRGIDRYLKQYLTANSLDPNVYYEDMFNMLTRGVVPKTYEDERVQLDYKPNKEMQQFQLPTATHSTNRVGNRFGF